MGEKCRRANVPDETHHSDGNILSFFGFKSIVRALKSQDAVTQVELRSERWMEYVPRTIGRCYSLQMSCIAEFVNT